MGGCMSHIKEEMQTPPPRPGNWEGLAPQRFQPYDHAQKSNQRQKQADGGPIKRFETPSGIEGLTFDQAGRPVWRNPKLASENGVEVKHVESSK